MRIAITNRIIMRCALVIVIFTATLSLSQASDTCNPDKMTVYRMVLHTYWTREKFPKHYPDWRPQAQWSKVFGVSHDPSFVLFRLGQRVSSAVREFAENGHTETLNNDVKGTMDVFSASAINQGEGTTESDFYVDGNHSRISMVSRMIPSPDWFIGVDGFDLCVDGNWIDSITIELDPLDAGTDNGFTFTAANWPTSPQGIAYRITSRYPSHPAGSFYYPHLRRLPPIATVQFIKLREYEVSEVFHHASDVNKYDVLQLEQMEHNNIDLLDGNQALDIAVEVERREETLPRVYNKDGIFKSTPDNTYYSIFNETQVTTTEPRSINELQSNYNNSTLHGLKRRYRARRRRKYRTDVSTSVPLDTAATVKARHEIKSKRKRQQCRVSSWGKWTTCSGGCGVGESHRTRRVIRPGSAGNGCPPLLQTRWCVTSRNNCTMTNDIRQNVIGYNNW